MNIKEAIKDRHKKIKNTCDKCNSELLFTGNTKITEDGLIKYYKCTCGITEKIIKK